MMVPKDEIKYVFNEPVMKSGDILLMNTYESQRRLMPGCQYDHAAIYLGDAFLMEADGTGVVMNQFLVSAVRHIDKDAEAVKVLNKQKWMTPPADQTNIIWPWYNDDNTFFAHFASTEKVLFFLYNQFLHYDKTNLPIFRENAMNVWILSRMRKDSQVVQVMAQHFKEILDEAIRVRKRLEKLYVDTLDKDEEGFIAFSKKYGFYHDYEYNEGVIDISRTLSALLQYGPENISDYLKD